jgi:hypothetical protein
MTNYGQNQRPYSGLENFFMAIPGFGAVYGLLRPIWMTEEQAAEDEFLSARARSDNELDAIDNRGENTREEFRADYEWQFTQAMRQARSLETAADRIEGYAGENRALGLSNVKLQGELAHNALRGQAMGQSQAMGSFGARLGSSGVRRSGSAARLGQQQEALFAEDRDLARRQSEFATTAGATGVTQEYRQGLERAGDARQDATHMRTDYPDFDSAVTLNPETGRYELTGTGAASALFTASSTRANNALEDLYFSRRDAELRSDYLDLRWQRWNDNYDTRAFSRFLNSSADLVGLASGVGTLSDRFGGKPPSGQKRGGFTVGSYRGFEF